MVSRKLLSQLKIWRMVVCLDKNIVSILDFLKLKTLLCKCKRILLFRGNAH